MKKPVWSNKEIADIASGMGNVILVFTFLLFTLYLVVPIFGGKFQPRAIIFYGCWIGISLIMKYISKDVRDKIRMKKQKWYIISTLMILFTLVWFTNYLGLIMSVLIVFGYAASYRALGKAGWQDEH